MAWLVGFKKATACNWKTMFELEHGVDEKDLVKFIFIQMSGISWILTRIQASWIPMINVVHKTNNPSLKASIYHFKINRKFPSKNYCYSTLNKARKEFSDLGGE